MKKSILLLIITLLLSSCAVSSLQIESTDELVLKQNSKDYDIGKSVDSNLLRFVRLDITQNSIKANSSSTLFYEQIITDQAYQFSRGSVETLQIIFDFSKSNIIYKSGNLLFVQFEVNDGKYLNLIAEISALQDMSYVYGYTNEEFIAMAKKMELDIDIADVRKSFIPKQPITKWSQTRLIIEPILEPFGKRDSF